MVAAVAKVVVVAAATAAAMGEGVETVVDATAMAAGARERRRPTRPAATAGRGIAAASYGPTDEEVERQG